MTEFIFNFNTELQKTQFENKQVHSCNGTRSLVSFVTYQFILVNCEVKVVPELLLPL